MINTIYNDDCINAEEYIEDNSIDLIFTSPPYTDRRLYGHPDAQCCPEKYVEWFIPKAKVFHSLLKDTGSFILNIGDVISNRCIDSYSYELVLEIEKQCGFKRFETIFWDKGKSPPSSNRRFRNTVEYVHWFVKEDCENIFKLNMDAGRKPYDPKTVKRYKKDHVVRHTRNSNEEKCDVCGLQKEYKGSKLICSQCGTSSDVKMKKVELNPLGALPSTLLKIGSEPKNTGYHTAVFPKALAKYFIGIATDEGDLVFDPFSGNGTVAISCIDLKRNYLGMELVPKIYLDGAKRIEKHIKELKTNEPPV